MKKINKENAVATIKENKKPIIIGLVTVLITTTAVIAYKVIKGNKCKNENENEFTLEFTTEELEPTVEETVTETEVETEA